MVKTFIPDEIIVTEDALSGGVYVRSAGCTAGCGLCCEYMVLPLRREAPPRGDGGPSDYHNVVRTVDGYYVWLDSRIADMPVERFRDMQLWASYHGVIIDLPDYRTYIPTHDISIYESGDWLACRINLACGKLDRDADGDGWCGVFGTDERPQLCARTPRHPLDVEGIKECTYEWEKAPDLEAGRAVALRQKFARILGEAMATYGLEEEASERERRAD